MRDRWKEALAIYSHSARDYGQSTGDFLRTKRSEFQDWLLPDGQSMGEFLKMKRSQLQDWLAASAVQEGDRPWLLTTVSCNSAVTLNTRPDLDTGRSAADADSESQDTGQLCQLVFLMFCRVPKRSHIDISLIVLESLISSFVYSIYNHVYTNSRFTLRSA